MKVETYLLTMYSFQRPGDRYNPPATEIIEVNGPTEACGIRDRWLRERVHAIREHASHVRGWSLSDLKRRRKDVLHQASYLHATVERIQ